MTRENGFQLKIAFSSCILIRILPKILQMPIPVTVEIYLMLKFAQATFLDPDVFSFIE